MLNVLSILNFRFKFLKGVVIKKLALSWLILGLASTGVWRLAVSGVVVLIGLGLGVGTFSVSPSTVATSVGPSCASAAFRALIFLGDGVGTSPGEETTWRFFRGVFLAGDEAIEVTLLASGLVRPRSGH